MTYLIISDDYSSFTLLGSSRTREGALKVLNTKENPRMLSIYAVEDESQDGGYVDLQLEPARFDLEKFSERKTETLLTKATLKECAQYMAQAGIGFKYRKVQESHIKGCSEVWCSNVDNVELRQYFDAKVHVKFFMTPVEMKYVKTDQSRTGDAGTTL